MHIHLEIPLRAVPHQSVRMTRSGHSYQPKKIVDYKDAVEEMVRSQLPDHFSIIPKGTPIMINKIHYQFEIPKSWSRKKKAEAHWMTSRPDLHDNLNKALFDALEGVIWEADHNVVKIDNMEKYYGEDNLITMEIQCLNS